MIDDDDEDHDFGTKKSISGPAQKKKGASTALIDAVSILASARSEGEEKKYTFLSEHLQQQSELRQKELDLERERLEIEREKNLMEGRRTQLMMKQLEATLHLGVSSGKDFGQHHKGSSIVIDETEEGDDDLLKFSDI